MLLNKGGWAGTNRASIQRGETLNVSDSESKAPPRFTNRLSKETSPYLLQHQHNPVDWYPWGEEAFEKARREGKPLLISIGYSACHWCHVMERESFENEEIARVINETVVPVKVDREERPDVDAIYMNACMMMTGQGGWPLNAFVTPDRFPFFVGTYFPPESRYGRAGFRQLLERIHEAWKNEREDLVKQAGLLHEQFDHAASPGQKGPIEADILQRAVREASAQFDLRWGGFSQAPKFPPDQRLALLLCAYHELQTESALSMVAATLRAMASGGIYDQIGGGFARYSVDEKWLVPHFEKMLYNQGLLVPVYLDAFLVNGNSFYARIARETIQWVLRDMQSPAGMFYSALDADSEGEEGKYYIWKTSELEEVLGREDADFISRFYGMTTRGNFENETNIAHIPVPVEEFIAGDKISEQEFWDRMLPLREKLLKAREKRVPPGTDDKCLTCWNGLMITALCRGYQVLEEPAFLVAAQKAADFILSKMRREDGGLLRSYCKGEAKIAGVLDDYAYFVASLIDLYESCFDLRYLMAARELAGILLKQFEDHDNGGFFFTSGDDPSLISRTRELHDGALPAGSSVAAQSLFRLAAFFDDSHFRESADRAIANAGAIAGQAPGAFSSLILASRYAGDLAPQIVISGESEDAAVRDMLKVVWKTYLPARSIALSVPGRENELPLTKDKHSPAGPAAFVCRDFTCAAPVLSAAELEQQLAKSNSPS
jgi:uncharacterized protein YyaL (SSP411 family)